AENSLSDLRNVGFKTVKENEEVMERIRAGGMPVYKKTKCSTIDIGEIGLSDRMVNALRRAGVHKLNDLVLFLAENSL
ncbi:hypothetical protein EII25_07465, partial [Erysipelotrichaceae bacterium OH741_COT-311]